MWGLFQWFSRLRRAVRFLHKTDGEGYDERLVRAFHGDCPHCGKSLEWKKHSGRVFANTMKVCPDNHFAVEYHKRGVVTYHDREGDPIDYLFSRKFRLVKDTDHVDTKKIPKTDDDSPEAPDVGLLDEEEID